MQLTTLFGTTQLALQDALRRNLDAAGSTPRAPNFIVVALRRESFINEYSGEIRDETARFKRDLEQAMRAFVGAHGWSIGGSGTVVLNVVLRSMSVECEVEARIARSFYELIIEDDAGKRTVQVGSNPATVGRGHEFPTRGFIPVNDRQRVISRDHLLLTYSDLHLHARLLGRNTTTLNGTPMSETEMEVRNGDVIACGSCRIIIGRL